LVGEKFGASDGKTVGRLVGNKLGIFEG